MAQYGQGSKLETHTEKLRRQLAEWDSMWQKHRAEFQKLKPGPNLEDDYLSMRRQVVGAESKYLTTDDKILEVDVTQQRTISVIQDSRFNFDDTVSVAVSGVLFCLKFLVEEKRTTVNRFVNISQTGTTIIQELPDLP